MMGSSNFVIRGAGAWGTAMAIHLAKLGHSTVLVPRDVNKAKIINEKCENCFHLKGIALPKNLIIDAQFHLYLKKNTVVFLACPTQGLESVCTQLQPYSQSIHSVISLIKGLDKTSLKTPSCLIKALLPNIHVGCLSGPTYALEFACGKPSAMVLAIEEDSLNLQTKISNNTVRIYRSNDLLGVELGGCLKNIYAIGAGILDGLDLGDNARAAYLTRALKEMACVGTQLGGQKDTFYGLSGLGDLIATAQGNWSRNHTFGQEFAQGRSIEDLLSEKTVEGYWSMQCFYRLIENKCIEAPILQCLYHVFYENYPVHQAIQGLMTRSLKKEF